MTWRKGRQPMVEKAAEDSEAFGLFEHKIGSDSSALLAVLTCCLLANGQGSPEEGRRASEQSWPHTLSRRAGEKIIITRGLGGNGGNAGKELSSYFGAFVDQTPLRQGLEKTPVPRSKKMTRPGSSSSLTLRTLGGGRTEGGQVDRRGGLSHSFIRIREKPCSRRH